MHDEFINLYKNIKESKLDEIRDKFYQFCKKVVDEVIEDIISLEEGAHTICGLNLLDQNILNHLTNSEHEMIDIACDLELSDPHKSRPKSDWKVIQYRVNLYF